ncbi:MAG: hypothetical protein LM590_01705 [Thermofilum sp.]|nr:hypothetical protein [Thermofilum sp.]
MELYVVAAGVAVYLAVGAIYWGLGQRGAALRYFEDAVISLIFILVVQAIFSAASQVASLAGIEINLWSSLEVSKAFATASRVFWNASRRAVDLIFFVEAEKAVLASTPLTAPLVNVLSGSTGWSLSELSLVAIVYMHFSFVSEVFSMISAYMLTIGSTLTPVPKLRKLGVSLLSLYISTSLAIVFSSQITCDALTKTRLPQAVNPADWVNIASIVGDAAVELGRVMTLSLVASALATIGGIGLASAFDSIIVSVLKP